jgi:O-antigen/teichoic acid export membrane protein
LTRSLSLVGLLGVVATSGAWLLSGLALVFVGGQEYAEIQSRLWLFAVLGTVLAMLQLLVYSVLARQGQRSVYLVWAGLAVLVALGLTVSTLDALIAVVLSVDVTLLALLTLVSLYLVRHHTERPGSGFPVPAGGDPAD